jgi:transglutaminase-like putative cysteine protease
MLDGTHSIYFFCELEENARKEDPEALIRTHSSVGATHAWVEAFLGDVGWVAFDPTTAV